MLHYSGCWLNSLPCTGCLVGFLVFSQTSAEADAARDRGSLALLLPFASYSRVCVCVTVSKEMQIKIAELESLAEQLPSAQRWEGRSSLGGAAAAAKSSSASASGSAGAGCGSGSGSAAGPRYRGPAPMDDDSDSESDGSGLGHARSESDDEMPPQGACFVLCCCALARLL